MKEIIYTCDVCGKTFMCSKTGIILLPLTVSVHASGVGPLKELSGHSFVGTSVFRKRYEHVCGECAGVMGRAVESVIKTVEKNCTSYRKNENRETGDAIGSNDAEESPMKCYRCGKRINLRAGEGFIASGRGPNGEYGWFCRECWPEKLPYWMLPSSFWKVKK